MTRVASLVTTILRSPLMTRFAPLSARAAAGAALAALCIACVDPTAPDAGNADGGSTPPAGSVPAALVGNWRYGSVSPTNFWDDHSGVYAGNAYGFSDIYAFNRDGTFKENVYIYTQSYGCKTQAWVEMSGTVTFDAAAFTLHVAKGRFKTTSPCSASQNFDRDMTESERTERSKTTTYSLQTGAGAPYLMILDGRYDRAN